MIVAPRREARRADRWKMGEYGTTIRFYRPADDTWDITFISPPGNFQQERNVEPYLRFDDGALTGWAFTFNPYVKLGEKLFDFVDDAVLL